MCSSSNNAEKSCTPPRAVKSAWSGWYTVATRVADPAGMLPPLHCSTPSAQCSLLQLVLRLNRVHRRRKLVAARGGATQRFCDRQPQLVCGAGGQAGRVSGAPASAALLRATARVSYAGCPPRPISLAATAAGPRLSPHHHHQARSQRLTRLLLLRRLPQEATLVARQPLRQRPAADMVMPSGSS